MATIKQLLARQILDSRGIPTIEVTAGLSDGTTATASSPSGTSKVPMRLLKYGTEILINTRVWEFCGAYRIFRR